jgi:hypothetical protein
MTEVALDMFMEDQFRNKTSNVFSTHVPLLSRTMLKARSAIVRANALVDKTDHHAASHFDGETFEAGQARLRELRALVINSLEGGNVSQSQEALGQALHGVQDFYAHTYVSPHLMP